MIVFRSMSEHALWCCESNRLLGAVVARDGAILRDVHRVECPAVRLRERCACTAGSETGADRCDACRIAGDRLCALSTASRIGPRSSWIENAASARCMSNANSAIGLECGRWDSDRTQPAGAASFKDRCVFQFHHVRTCGEHLKMLPVAVCGDDRGGPLIRVLIPLRISRITEEAKGLLMGGFAEFFGQIGLLIHRRRALFMAFFQYSLSFQAFSLRHSVRLWERFG